MSNQPTGYQRHPVEIGPLVFGLVFLGVVAAWGLFELGVVTGADTAWILPIVLIGAGALGVVLALTKPRRTEARQAAIAAYASQWTPVGYQDQTGTYADTAYTGYTGADTDTATDTDTSTEAPVPEVQDDPLDETATTEVRADDSDDTDDTDDTESYADTYTDTSTYADPSTDQSFETDTRERHDD